MSEEVTEVKEITVETVKEETESPTEVEAQIAVAKAEASVQRAEEAVAIIEQTANIQIAQVAIEAEQQIAEHEEKVEELEYDQKWQLEMIKSLQTSMEIMTEKMTALELKLSAPTQLTDSLPQTVDIVETLQNGGEGDPQEQHENPIAEIVEAVETAPQKVKRKIRAL
jgi:hypothetical protein